MSSEHASSYLFFTFILLLFAFQAFFSSFHLSAVADEYPHIESGYSALVTGDFRMETEHPPLIKVLSALPLLALNLTFPIDHLSWEERKHFTFYKQFIFEANKGKEKLILYTARIPIIILGLFFLLTLFIFCKKKFGPSAALFASFLAAFDPNILAQSNIVMTDLGFMLFCFLYIISLYTFLQQPSGKKLLLTSAIFGIAQLTKFTAVFLAPLTIVFLVLYAWHQPLTKKMLVRNLIFLCMLGISALFFINTAYLFSHTFLTLEQQFLNDPSIDRTIYNPDKLFTNPITKWVFTHVPIPLPYHYIKGLAYVSIESQSPHPNYLFGLQEKGFKSYYLWTLLLKTPLPLLLLFMLGLFFGFHQPEKRKQTLFFLVPILFFIAAFSLSSKQNGLRYILQTYPFMILIALNTYSWLQRQRFLLLILLIWTFTGTLLSFPNYLAYHNELVSSQDWLHIFADPNVEIGQNLNALTTYLVNTNATHAHVEYWQKEHLREYWPVQFKNYTSCARGIIAVDTIALHVRPEFAHLLCLKPLTIIRDSIFIYNVSRVPHTCESDSHEKRF